MAEPEDFDRRDRPHVAIDAWRVTTAFTAPTNAQSRKPLRADYAAHADSLLVQLAAALPPPPNPAADGRAKLAGLPLGALITVDTLPPADGSRSKAAKLPGLDFAAQDIAVLRSQRNNDRSEGAVLFVPDAAQAFLRQRIAAYGSRNLGNRKRPDVDRFEVIETIAAAAAQALFTGPIDPDGPASWWELWTRPSLADGVAATARARGFEVHAERLYFPDTTIVMAHARAADLLLFAAQTPGALAEIRKATDTIRPFLERGDAVIGQADFVEELQGRLTGPPRGAPLVGVLDTGVSATHPLLAPGLAGALTYDEAWGTDDHAPAGGHGTGMVSLVLHGDLASAMADQRQVVMTHAAVSMKLLPPRLQPQTAPAHYGVVTQGAIAQIEIAHGDAARTFCLASSTDEFSPERPSGWSGALDQAASGGLIGDIGDPPRRAAARPKRLLVVATGNVEGGMREQVLASQPIEDPAQSWNALSIGGYTAKETVAPEDAPMRPLVAANTLSPFSRGSDTLADDLTPIKPEVLFEAGNMLVDAAEYCAWNPSVSLLAAGSDVQAEPLTPIWATSAATGLAGHFLGRLEAALPGLWPETYRALTVQAAEWPAPIRSQLIGRGDHWKTGRTATAAARKRLLRRVGFGVPDIDRAIASARNALTLTAQAEIQPFALTEDGRAVYNEMHFYDLPWPRQALQALENEIVTMKVTLSYFPEPNLTGRAATRPDTYRAFGLRFAMKRRGETGAKFRSRVNAAQDKDDEPANGEASYWLLGPKSVSAGSLHCDLWRGRAVDLALHDAVAVFPVRGWWKSHLGQRRVNDRGRYSLLISLQAPEQAIDLHAEVAAQVDVRAARDSDRCVGLEPHALRSFQIEAQTTPPLRPIPTFATWPARYRHCQRRLRVSSRRARERQRSS